MKSGELYDLLEVAAAADQVELRLAYRRLARENHPDHHPGDSVKEQRFKEVASAYAVLGDPEKRRKYDQRIEGDRQAEARQAEARQAEARQAEARQAEAARQAKVASRPTSVPSPYNTTELLLGLFKFGFGVLSAVAATRPPAQQSHWDPAVQRRRGPDGRFVSTKRQ